MSATEKYTSGLYQRLGVTDPRGDVEPELLPYETVRDKYPQRGQLREITLEAGESARDSCTKESVASDVLCPQHFNSPLVSSV